MSSYQPDAPVEDVNKGTVVALLALPAGVIVWVLVWTLGFIASIVTFAVAYLAMFLYKLGSGGTMGRAGAVRVAIITVVTLAVSIIAGLVADVANGIGSVTGVGPIEALSNPNFGQIFTAYVSDPDSGLLLSLGIAIVFGILGCFGVLRSAFGATATPTVQAPEQGYSPLVPPAAGLQYPDPSPTLPEPTSEPVLGPPIPGVPQFPSQVQPADGQAPLEPGAEPRL